MARILIFVIAFIVPTITSIPSAFAQYVPKPYKVPEDVRKTPTEFAAALDIGMPPVMPPTAIQSGYCCLSIDINSNGTPTKIDISYCSESKFELPSLIAARQWKFQTAMKDGQPMSWAKDMNLVTYHLVDENGNFLPDPNGLLSPDPRNKPNDIQALCAGDLIS